MKRSTLGGDGCSWTMGLLLLATAGAGLAPSRVSAVQIDAASMVMRSTGQVADTTGWLLWNWGFVGTLIEMPQAGTLTVTVEAAGQSSLGVWPIMDLHVADHKASWHVVSSGDVTDYRPYTATFELPAGTHYVRVEYTNDHFNATEDRNLYVKKVSFSGTPVNLVNTLTETTIADASDTYIANYRQGPAQVYVYDAAGTPIAAGTPVDVDLDRHAFMFGTTIYGLDMTHYQWVDPNPVPGSDPARYQQYQTQHFNSIAIENAGKWLYNEEVQDVVTMDFVDAIFDYAEMYDMDVRLHSCVWDFDAQEPGWVNTLQTDGPTDPVAAQTYRDEITERIQYYMADRAQRYTDVDGINESFHNPINTTIFGLDGVADMYNEMADAIDGRATLFTNEYSVLPAGAGDPYTNWYRYHVQQIIDEGGAVSGVGIQSHLPLGWDDLPTAFGVLQNLAGLERILKVTEFSLDDAEAGDKAKIMLGVMRLIFGNDQAAGFTCWGFWEPYMWRNGAALVATDWSVTALGTAYENLMAQWDTSVSTAATAGGALDFTGYFGDYTLDLGGETGYLHLSKGVTDYHVFLADPGAPSRPTDLIGRDVSTDSIRWVWRDHASDESGFNVYGDPGQGPPTTLQITRPADAEDWDQTGLQPNSPYVVQVAAVNANGNSHRTDAVVKHTLPVAPVFGSSGAGAVDCTAGSGDPGLALLPDSQITFQAVNGLGTGPDAAVAYRYAWGQSVTAPADWSCQPLWSQGDLSMTLVGPTGYYLHLRAVNADGEMNLSTLTLGPYVVVDQPSPDFDGDGDVDLADFGHLQVCLTGQAVAVTDPLCDDAKLDADSDVDQADQAALRGCLSGAGVPFAADCLD